jgi:hypothetical protein
MNPRESAEKKLEELTGRVLRQQPLRKAPPALESRVLAELGRRARRPWWRQSFAGWPAGGRAVLIAASLSCIPLLWLLAPWLWTHLASAAAEAGPIATIAQSGRVLLTLAAASARLANAIPRGWLLGGLAAAGALYCALLALVYSLLYLSPQHTKARPL